MAFTNIWQWQETRDDNTEIDGIALGENVMVPSGVNNAFREMMSQIITMEGKGADVASATTLTLGAERYYIVTGTTTIADIDFTDALNGRWVWLYFESALSLTHSTNLRLPGAADITTATGDTALFLQSSGGLVVCLSYQRAAVAPLNRAVDYGVYTPTLTNVTNVAASTVVAQFFYSRIGDMVNVVGHVTVDATTTLTSTDLGVSLPIASALTSGTQVAGTGAANGTVNETWAITGDAANDRANCRAIVQTAADHTVVLNFSYRVI